MRAPRAQSTRSPLSFGPSGFRRRTLRHCRRRFSRRRRPRSLLLSAQDTATASAEAVGSARGRGGPAGLARRAPVVRGVSWELLTFVSCSLSLLPLPSLPLSLSVASASLLVSALPRLEARGATRPPSASSPLSLGGRLGRSAARGVEPLAVPGLPRVFFRNVAPFFPLLSSLFTSLIIPLRYRVG